jgi:DNA-binding NarL/FixJ family response regulator
VYDHPIMREGIAAGVVSQSDLELAGTASNGPEAIRGYCELQPDVCLMDLQLPEMSGIDAPVATQSVFSSGRVIMLTTFVGDVGTRRALSAGARTCRILTRRARS